jgi:DNA polymerase alpha subunit A
VASRPVSWCRYEFEIEKPSLVFTPDAGSTVREPPPLSLMALSFKTVVNPTNNQAEIVVASAIVHNKVNVDGSDSDLGQGTGFTLIRKLSSQIVHGPGMPKDFANQLSSRDTKHIKICENEKTLLDALVAQIQNLDPDVLVGHTLVGMDIELLLRRMQVCKIATWSCLGRLKRNKMPNLVTISKKNGSKFNSLMNE